MTLRDRLILLASRRNKPLDDILELFCERAAIMEYLGEMSRAEAEMRALEAMEENG